MAAGATWSYSAFSGDPAGISLAMIVLDEVDVAVVFRDRRADEDRIGVAEVRFHLIEQPRNLADARKHVAETHVVRRVALRERQEQRAADQLDRNRGVVAVILNFVEFEQVEADLIVNELPIGGVLGTERRERSLGAKAFAPAGVERALRVHGLQAQVVELRVELDLLARLRIHVNVISGLRSDRRRERERILHESVAERGKFLRIRRGGCARGRARLSRAGWQQNHEREYREANGNAGRRHLQSSWKFC